TRAAALDTALNVSYQLAGFAAQEGNLAEVVALVDKAALEGTTPDEIDLLAQSLIGQGTTKQGDAALTWINTGRKIARTDVTRAMADYYEGSLAYNQAMSYLPANNTTAPSKSAAQRAVPVFRRAKALMQGASAFSAAAEARRQILSNIDQYLEYLQQIANG
ncbi:MAG TPA: hypothetical protein VF035_09060, partial [Longimicrobiales bacterium]